MEEKVFELLSQLSSRLDAIENRLDSMDDQLNTVVSGIQECKAGIARIDRNVSIIATSTGHPYNLIDHVVEPFRHKIG